MVAAPQPSPPPAAPVGLPEDLRGKYIEALSRKGENWVWGLGFVVGLLLTAAIAQAAGFDGKWVPLASIVLALLGAGFAVDRYRSWRARSLGSHSDKMLEVSYAEHERARTTSRVYTAIGVLALIGIASWWVFDTPEGERFRLSLTSDASCALGQVFHRPEVFLVDGQFDAGYVIYTTIENQGGDGRILVEARLTTSEGVLTKRQWETFARAERREVRINFPEPTVAAANATSYLSCAPAR